MALTLNDHSRLPKDFAIFYCWQDHLDKKIHRYLIRDCLSAAISRVQAELPDDAECELRLDSDTSGRSGTVDIADTILEKIRTSAMVVGDVTPVFRDTATERYYPNPNVMFELGYAASVMGWNRVVCVYNEHDITPEKLPFDLRHRRVSSYSAQDATQRTIASRELEATLTAAIRAVIQSIARGEFDPSLTKNTKRQKDRQLLEEILKTVNRGVMDSVVDAWRRHQVYEPGLFMWETFNGFLGSSYVRFYDKNIEPLLQTLHRTWDQAMSHSANLFYPGRHSLVMLPEHMWTSDTAKRVKQFDRAVAQLPRAFREFLNYVHEIYDDIDLDETDRAAWDEGIKPYLVNPYEKPSDPVVLTEKESPSQVKSFKTGGGTRKRVRRTGQIVEVKYDAKMRAQPKETKDSKTENDLSSRPSKGKRMKK